MDWERVERRRKPVQERLTATNPKAAMALMLLTSAFAQKDQLLSLFRPVGEMQRRIWRARGGGFDVTVTLFEVLLTGLRTYLFAHTANRVDVELGARLFRHLFALPIGYFQARRVGDSVTRVRELETIRQFLAIDRAEVDDREVRIVGRKDVLEQAVLANGGPVPGGRSFVRKWRSLRTCNN